MNMKSIFENVINKGNYDLTSLLKRIDTYHIEGKLTDGERDALYTAARKEPTAQYNYDSEIEKLWAAIRELQNKNSESSGDSTETTIAEFVQPTGAHDAYNTGDVVTYNGVTYACVRDNCVWAPDVYPDAWKEVTA